MPSLCLLCVSIYDRLIADHKIKTIYKKVKEKKFIWEISGLPASETLIIDTHILEENAFHPVTGNINNGKNMKLKIVLDHLLQNVDLMIWFGFGERPLVGYKSGLALGLYVVPFHPLNKSSFLSYCILKSYARGGFRFESAVYKRCWIEYYFPWLKTDVTLSLYIGSAGQN